MIQKSEIVGNHNEGIKKTMSYLQEWMGEKSRKLGRWEELQKRNIWNGNCIGQRIREKQNIKPYEVKRNCFAESYLLEYYWSNRVQG